MINIGMTDPTVERKAYGMSGTVLRPHVRPVPMQAPARHPFVVQPEAGGDAGTIERLCLERGLRMTGQRRVIARVLSEAVDHPDVEEVYRRAQVLDQRISIATVYRTVRLFEERGILHRRDFGNGRARWEPTEHGHHHHLIDVETGKVIEFSDPAHELLVRRIVKQLGFELVSLRLELFGRRRATPDDGLAPDGKPRRAASRKVEGAS